mgnify:CR=1 FL=1
MSFRRAAPPAKEPIPALGAGGLQIGPDAAVGGHSSGHGDFPITRQPAMIGCQGFYEFQAGRTAGWDLNAYATRDKGEAIAVNHQVVVGPAALRRPIWVGLGMRPCGPMRPCPRPALSTAFPSGTATWQTGSSTTEMSGTSSRAVEKVHDHCDLGLVRGLRRPTGAPIDMILAGVMQSIVAECLCDIEFRFHPFRLSGGD